jgi:two-component system chemotaxis response regulator CheB
MGIVLSGGDGDGAAGLRIIREHGGTALVQDPEEAERPSMPLSALIADHPDACLPVAEIAECVRAFCSGEVNQRADIRVGSATLRAKAHGHRRPE